ncbi:rod shape-determining protein RodA [Ferruginibacter sp. SUN106]|uniref:rod shape-determining protein RodA n=1 Tax=Ferruginibacter sp. SUN106 TaxID=2978348 RepID=UPI003D36FE34
MYKKNPSISKGIDWVTVMLYLLLVLIGLTCIFSVEYKSGDNVVQTFLGLKKEYSKQLLFFGVSVVVAVFILLTDSKFFTATSNLAYAFGILLILATFAVGKEVGGSKSWIAIGSFMNIQPVELCKIFTSLALAKYLSMPETNFHKIETQLIAAAIAFSPAILSVLQKEPGAAIVYFSFAIAFYREGLPTLYLIILFSFAILVIASIVISSNTFFIAITIVALLFVFIYWRKIKRDIIKLFLIIAVWGLCIGVKLFVVPALFNSVLKPHQVVRIFATFGIDDYKFKDSARVAEIQKEFAKLGTTKKKPGEKVESYNVKQSKIAIGSGGFWGKGFLQGTQTRGEFVPAQNTDFIFSSVGENFGFWGCMVLMILYFGLMIRLVFLAERQRSTFSRVYMYCVVGILFFHVALNVCMTLGLAPSPGITLPLLSYGGSSLITFTILLFISVKLDADRHMILR